MDRRLFVASALAGAVSPAGANGGGPDARPSLYGLIGRMTAQPGQRDALVAILLEGTGRMPGNLSYIVAADAADADSIWITEVWDSAESHRASLKLPEVRAAIGKARPLIAGMSDGFVTRPVGGHGLLKPS